MDTQTSRLEQGGVPAGNQKETSDLFSLFGKGISVIKRDGTVGVLNIQRLQEAFLWAANGYTNMISMSSLIQEALKNMFNGISEQEIEDALILGSVPLIEHDAIYSKVSARLLLKKTFKEVTGQSILRSDVTAVYKKACVDYLQKALDLKILDKKCAAFDFEFLSQNIIPERDSFFDYMGLKTLYERYFIKHEGKRLELPQIFWMRVAMGLAINEEAKNQRAVEFYNLMSQLLYLPSTPTLLHAGLVGSQLSSCFLSTVNDDLLHIFKCIGDNAQISKWSGGLGTDWTNVRATGSLIKSIKTESQGVIPFLKIANDTTAAINRSGSRRSAAVVYLETWHLDIEDFLDLRRNTGDERRRTHDINTANWIPDLFMKRVIDDGDWTLFSPEETPELHHIYGREFEKKYAEYEAQARKGMLQKYKVISAKKLWKKMLSRLFETGHPWFTFKDPCNVRSPQDHVGVIHSSNLCTEITLNTSQDETAVCNLGSINLSKHITDGVLDKSKLAKTIKTAIRMLDNVIDANYYPTKETETSNMRHRPIGLGMMGLQDVLYMLDIPFDSPEVLPFVDSTMEFISYNAIFASSELAQERGAYESYKGSKWERGLFPQDTIALLEQERDMPIEAPGTSVLDWQPVREHVKKYGMRNSNTMAIAPTATISNIAGCYPSIEPIYKNMYVKANMSGEFTIVNKYLMRDLKALGIWNDAMRDTLKYYDGNLSQISEIPQNIKNKYKEAFDIDPQWLVTLTAARGKWIDQSQSHNVFMKGVSGKKLSELYIAGWKKGLKTFYYLRTLGASQIEKATLDAKKFGFTQKRMYEAINESQSETPQTVYEKKEEDIIDDIITTTTSASCNIMEDPSCEVCQ